MIEKKKENYSNEEEGEAQDFRKLNIDSQKISVGKTRKGLYVKDGINICAICVN